MYAVLSSGGKQYRVEAGTILTMERLEGEPGSPITFDRVLLIADGDDVTIGTPVVDGASVSATLLGESRGPKLVIFKFKQKVKYRRRTGHRQQLTSVRIDAIHPRGLVAEKATDAAPDQAAALPRAASRRRAKTPVATAPAEAADTKPGSTPRARARRAKPTKE